MTSNKVISLEPRDHVLLRPTMYIGSTDLMKVTKRSFFEDNKLVFNKELEYIPGLIKIIEEIIDNSVDEALKTKFKFSNKIQVTMKEDSVIVKDNGRGIAIEKNEDGLYYPFVAWNNLMTGSNFEDHRISIGANGAGSALTNIFSKKFIGKTKNNHKSFTGVWTDNAKHYRETIKDISSDNTGTIVEFYPDFSRFTDRTKFEPIDFSIIKDRLIKLSLEYPEIKFYFNNERISSKLSDFLDADKTVKVGGLKTKDYEIHFMPSKSSYDTYADEFMILINGLDIQDGTPIQLIKNKVFTKLASKLKKRFKSLTTAHVTNSITTIILFRNFENLKFTSQTKEVVSNNLQSIQNFLKDVDFDSLVNRLSKSKFIVEPILDFYRAQEEFKEKLTVIKSRKRAKRIKSDKYLPAIKETKYLILAEGDSPAASISTILGRNNFGYISMFGVPLNAWEEKISKVATSKKFEVIQQVLDIDYVKKTVEGPYETVLLATDSDLDGIHIRGLLIAYFYRFTSLIQDGRLKILRTPLVFAHKNNKVYKYFFTFKEFQDFQKVNTDTSLTFKYTKGLGGLDKNEMRELIRVKGLDHFIDPVEIGDHKKEFDILLDKWFMTTKADDRKELVKATPFNINIL